MTPKYVNYFLNMMMMIIMMMMMSHVLAHKYKVTVVTGKRDNAGTDANVHITLFGELGDSGERNLDDPAKDDFESGQ
jgi:hypothetical protein